MEVESARPRETRGEAFVDRFDLVWETVGGDDDLPAELVEGIEDVEKFFLTFFLTDDKLDVVDDETVEFFEFFAELFTFTVTDRFDEVGVEVVDWGIEDFIVRIVTEEFVADSLDEVSLTEARAAVEVERVITFARVIDDAFCDAGGEIVARGDDKIIESVVRVQGIFTDSREGVFEARFTGEFFFRSGGGFLFGSDLARANFGFFSFADDEV